MRVLLVAGLAVALMIGPAEADVLDPRESAAFIDGNHLRDMCADPGTYAVFVAGVVDTMRAVQEAGGSLFGRRVCLPKSVILSQAKDVVVRFLREHPEWMQYSAAKLVAVALDGAFLCPAAPPAR